MFEFWSVGRTTKAILRAHLGFWEIVIGMFDKLLTLKLYSINTLINT